MFPFYTPLKTPENLRFSEVLWGFEMGILTRKWVKLSGVFIDNYGEIHFSI